MTQITQIFLEGESSTLNIRFWEEIRVTNKRQKIRCEASKARIFTFNKIKRLRYVYVTHKPLKDTHKENTPSNKTEALTKSINMYVWVIGASNQLFIRGSYNQIKFSKKKMKQSVAKFLSLW